MSDNNIKSQNFKAQLFGTFKIPGGAKTLDQKAINELRMPLEGPSEGFETVMKLFCNNCGYVTEITHKGLEILSEKGIIKIPDNLEGLYLETNSCSICMKDDIGAKLKNIPSNQV